MDGVEDSDHVNGGHVLVNNNNNNNDDIGTGKQCKQSGEEHVNEQKREEASIAAEGIKGVMLVRKENGNQEADHEMVRMNGNGNSEKPEEAVGFPDHVFRPVILGVDSVDKALAAAVVAAVAANAQETSKIMAKSKADIILVDDTVDADDAVDEKENCVSSVFIETGNNVEGDKAVKEDDVEIEGSETDVLKNIPDNANDVTNSMGHVIEDIADISNVDKDNDTGIVDGVKVDVVDTHTDAKQDVNVANNADVTKIKDEIEEKIEEAANDHIQESEGMEDTKKDVENVVSADVNESVKDVSVDVIDGISDVTSVINDDKWVKLDLTEDEVALEEEVQPLADAKQDSEAIERSVNETTDAIIADEVDQSTSETATDTKQESVEDSKDSIEAKPGSVEETGEIEPNLIEVNQHSVENAAESKQDSANSVTEEKQDSVEPALDPATPIEIDEENKESEARDEHNESSSAAIGVLEDVIAAFEDKISGIDNPDAPNAEEKHVALVTEEKRDAVASNEKDESIGLSEEKKDEGKGDVVIDTHERAIAEEADEKVAGIEIPLAMVTDEKKEEKEKDEVKEDVVIDTHERASAEEADEKITSIEILTTMDTHEKKEEEKEGKGDENLGLKIHEKANIEEATEKVETVEHKIVESDNGANKAEADAEITNEMTTAKPETEQIPEDAKLDEDETPELLQDQELESKVANADHSGAPETNAENPIEITDSSEVLRDEAKAETPEPKKEVGVMDINIDGQADANKSEEDTEASETMADERQPPDQLNADASEAVLEDEEVVGGKVEEDLLRESEVEMAPIENAVNTEAIAVPKAVSSEAVETKQEDNHIEAPVKEMNDAKPVEKEIVTAQEDSNENSEVVLGNESEESGDTSPNANKEISSHHEVEITEISQSHEERNVESSPSQDDKERVEIVAVANEAVEAAPEEARPHNPVLTGNRIEPKDPTHDMSLVEKEMTSANKDKAVESDEDEAEAASVFHGRLEMVPDGGNKVTVVDRSSSDTVSDANHILREIHALAKTEEVTTVAEVADQQRQRRAAPEISIEHPSPDLEPASPKAGSDPEPESPEISIRLEQASPDSVQSPDESMGSPERLVIVVDSAPTDPGSASASDMPSLITVNTTSGTTSIAITTTAPIVTATAVSTSIASSPDVVVASHAKFVSTVAIVENVDKRSPVASPRATRNTEEEKAEPATTPVASPRLKKDEERKTPISTPKISKKTPVSSPRTAKKTATPAAETTPTTARSPPTSPRTTRRLESKPEREQQGVLQYLCNPCLACFKRKK